MSSPPEAAHAPSSGAAAAPADPGAAFIAELAGAGAESLAPPPQRFRYGGIAMLVTVALIAAGVLFGMRWLGQARKLSLLNVKIDYPLNQKTEGATDHAAVLDQLKSSELVVQVPLEQIQMNPFMWNDLNTTKPDTANVDESARQAELSRRAAEQHRQMLLSTLSKLKVNSILGGSAPMARLSGALVRVGDQIDDLFTVVAITGRSVELEAEGEKFTLNLGD